MSRGVWIKATVLVKVDIEDTEYSNSVSTNQIVDDVMENCDYNFSFEDSEGNYNIDKTEIEEWKVEEEV